MSNVVFVENVSFGYKRRNIVNDLSFTLANGKFLYIKGYNGSGKSTLLKLICGLFKPTSGRVMIFEKEPHKIPSVLKSMGVVLDGIGLYKDLSLHDNIVLFAKEKGLNRDEIADRLRILEMETDVNFSAKYKKSSHGMRKVAKLVLSLINSPELLILDEPELALDEKRKAWLLSKLEFHKKSGKSVVIAGTDPKQFEDLIDDVIEMRVVM